MEADTKKRGRPQIISDFHKNLFNDFQGRALTNLYYVITAQGIICNSWAKDKFNRHFVKSTGQYKRQAILEQIGRMYLQNNYCENDCMMITEKAIEMLESKWTVKQVESWIRYGRNYNKW